MAKTTFQFICLISCVLLLNLCRWDNRQLQVLPINPNEASQETSTNQDVELLLQSNDVPVDAYPRTAVKAPPESRLKNDEESSSTTTSTTSTAKDTSSLTSSLLRKSNVGPVDAYRRTAVEAPFESRLKMDGESSSTSTARETSSLTSSLLRKSNVVPVDAYPRTAVKAPSESRLKMDDKSSSSTPAKGASSSASSSTITSSASPSSSSSPSSTSPTTFIAASSNTTSNSALVYGLLPEGDPRLKFLRHRKEMRAVAKTLRERKPTPSGWWPNRRFIEKCTAQKRNLTEFPSAGDWYDYRLGDCVKICRGCPNKNHRHRPQLAHWTIAGEYWDRACEGGLHQEKGNETLLDEIIESRAGQPGFVKPDSDALVIHMRLGDKLEHSEDDVYKFLNYGGNAYANGAGYGHRVIKNLFEIMTDVSAANTTKVIIRGGSQWPRFFEKSKTYAHCVQEAIAKAGYEVEMNLDEENADADFYYLSHARHLITSMGGYSRFIAHSVLRRGGVVYGRVF